MDGDEGPSLLDFPPELRNTIYEYALNDSGNILIFDCKESGSSFPRRSRAYRRHDLLHSHSRLSPALLATCKQVYTEAIGHLYDQEITFGNSYSLRSFLLHIGPGNRKLVTHIRISDFYCFPLKPQLPLLASATNIKAIRVDFILKGSRQSDEDAAKCVWSQLRVFFKEYGRVQGRADPALHVFKFAPNATNDARVWHGSVEAELRRLMLA